MAKVTGPFFSLDARGTIADTLTASFWRGINYIRVRVIPQNPKTTDQVGVREIFTNGVLAWHTDEKVSAEDRTAWSDAYQGLPLSGFNAFMKAYCEANNDENQPADPEVIPEVPA